MKGNKDNVSSSEEENGDKNDYSDNRMYNNERHFFDKHYNQGKYNKKRQAAQEYQYIPERQSYYTQAPRDGHNYSQFYNTQDTNLGRNDNMRRNEQENLNYRDNYQENIYEPYIRKNLRYGDRNQHENAYDYKSQHAHNYTIPSGYNFNLEQRENYPHKNIKREGLQQPLSLTKPHKKQTAQPKKRYKNKIEYIKEKNRRNVTFSKRKKGIMKKAYELSTLTGSDLLLIVASESGHVFTYASERLKPFIIESQDRIEYYLSSKDGSVKFEKKELD